MTVYAVLLPVASPAFEQRIAVEFPTDHLKVTDTQWLVSAGGTAVDISNRLGLSEAQTTVGIVFATAGYFGRAPTNVWEWIKNKLESPLTISGTGTPSAGLLNS
jgi:hypothetical protein